MPRKKHTPARALAQAHPANLATSSQHFAIGDAAIEPAQIYRVPERHPADYGPWDGEPDKLAWRDEPSGLACIILRSPDGTLGGYVAIAPEHPLWGFRHDALPEALGVHIHRGLDYAALCAHRDPESISICHVHEGSEQLGQRAMPGSDAGGGDKDWWFGFGCNKRGDLVPSGPKPALHREAGEVYRPLAYVYRETVALARQLKAIADGATEAGKGGDTGPQLLGAPLSSALPTSASSAERAARDGGKP